MPGQFVVDRANDLDALSRRLRAPPADLARSPAALRVARLATRRGLFLFDYEQRHQLPLPESWLPMGRPDLGVTGLPPGWERGLLGESKYLSFRHDTLIGSLHPGHRAKWGAHELCHGLVGFCWRPDGSPLFHALAARVAEALPVALWYFFDEAGAVRCERHRAQRELGPSYCAPCERAAARAAVGTDEDASWISRGLDYLERELEAARASLRLGRPVFSPHGAIDLMQDGLAYAAAHEPRLRSPELARAMELLFEGEPATESGRFDGLDAFIDHVAALGLQIAGREPLGDVYTDVATHIDARRWRLIAQDLGARLMQVAADCDEESAADLTEITALLGRRHDEPAVIDAIAAYTALYEAIELPPPDEVLAVGYPLPGGHGVAIEQLLAGLDSSLPTTMARLDDEERVALVREHAAVGPRAREPLPLRFATFLRERVADTELAGLAELEAAIACVEPPDPIELGLARERIAGDDELVLATGTQFVRPGFDAGGLLLGGGADDDGPRSFLVRRTAADEVIVVALGEPLADRLARGPIHLHSVMQDPSLQALAREGALVSIRWKIS